MFGKIFWINIHTTSDCLTCSLYTSKKMIHKNLTFYRTQVSLNIECFICMFFLPELPHLRQLQDRGGQQPTQEPGNGWDCIVCLLHQKYLQCLSDKTSTSTIADENDSPWTSTTDHAGLACHHPGPLASCAWSPAENPVRWLSPWKILEYICPPPIFVLSI